MIELLNIIKGTPLYVWFIFFYLLFIGIKSLNKRVIYLPKLFIIPLVLLAIKYKAFLSEDFFAFALTIMFCCIASFFIHVGSNIKIIKNLKSVELPGSYSTLMMIIFIFLTKYFFGYLKATESELMFKYSLIETIINGIFSGYYLGRAMGYTYKYLKAENYKEE